MFRMERTAIGEPCVKTLVQVRDRSALDAWVDEVLAASPAELARYRSGDTKLAGFFVGQVMKKSRGTADPKAVAELVARRAASDPST